VVSTVTIENDKIKQDDAVDQQTWKHHADQSLNSSTAITPADSLMDKALKMDGQSWGDKYKGKAFGFNTYFLLNYVANTLIAASVAYAFERTVGGAVDRWTERTFTKNASAAQYAIRAVALTMGGTSLLLPIKHLEENKQEYLYSLSQMLDKTQEALGQGNADSKKNLEEYKQIAEAARALHSGKEPCMSLDAMKAVEKKYHFTFCPNGDLEFDKIHKPWWKLGLTRVAAIASAMATGGLLGWTKNGDKPTEAQMDAGYFGNTGYGKLETRFVPSVGAVIGKIPGLNRLIKKHNMAGMILMQDAALTMVSDAIHVATDRFLDSHQDKDLLKKIDANKDGWITQKEAEAFLGKKFAKLDKDNDGQIAPDEGYVKGELRRAKNGYIEKREQSHAQQLEKERQTAGEHALSIAP
jgi:hypothetical protein